MESGSSASTTKRWNRKSKIENRKSENCSPCHADLFWILDFGFWILDFTAFQWLKTNSLAFSSDQKTSSSTGSGSVQFLKKSLSLPNSCSVGGRLKHLK